MVNFRLLLSISVCISIQLQLINAESIVLEWNNALLNAIAKTNTPPTIAARAMAIVHTAMFDAWAAYDGKALGTQYGNVLRRPANEFTDANKQQAISFAALRTLLALFPTQASSFQALMTNLGYNPLDTSTDLTTPTGIGNSEAQNLLLFRGNDGANQLANEPNTSGGAYSDYTGYTPPNAPFPAVPVDPSLWQPLPGQKCLTPQWGLVKPFSLFCGSELRPKLAPAWYPSKRFLKQAEEIIELSANLNDETKAIAVFWADGGGTVTPPGHWNQIAQFVSHRDHLSLDKDIQLFFILNNALLDVSIAVWEAKCFYDSVRPATAIRFLFANKTIQAWAGPCLGTKSIAGGTWQSYIPTPPFPEYVSGHSTFSAASAQVLTCFTGSSNFGGSAVVPKGSSFVEPGCAPTQDVTLSWATFKDAANQAGLSRRYGGIHFKDGDCQGRKLGKSIGKNVFERAQFFIRGGHCKR